MTLTAEQILKVVDVGEIVKVDIPEWKGFVCVKVMDGAARDRFELATSKAVQSPNTANVRASLVVACACDEEGKRLFTDNQVANVGKKSAIALDRIYEVAKHLNKLEDEDIEELEKN